MLGYSLPSGNLSKKTAIGTTALMLVILGCYLILAAPVAGVSKNHAAGKMPAVDVQAAAPQTNEVTTSVETVVDTSSSAVGGDTNLTINGQQVPLGPGGSVHKTIPGNSGNTSVDISVNSNSTGSNQIDSSTNIQLNTNTQSEVIIESSE